jgi:Leucine-rich repeat (LRR) protein
MIESITGIYTTLSNITKLDLRNNRIENLCGLERLWSLEYVDIRDNRLTDWAEVSRMTELQEIRQIYVEGNPFTQVC